MILGINYSSYHDSSVAIIDSSNHVIFAASEERYSRVKKDGRFPIHALSQIDLGSINLVSVPYCEQAANVAGLEDPLFKDIFYPAKNLISTLPNIWREQILSLGKQTYFFDHHESHAAAGIFFSGFESCNVITSDFGADNTSTSTGIYRYTPDGTLQKIHSADIRCYEPLCSIYTFVTTLLGFRPNHHEGKITGLAATAPFNLSAQNALEFIFLDYLSQREASNRQIFQWAGRWSSDTPPELIVDPRLVKKLREKLLEFSDATLARAAQDIIERKMLELLTKLELDGNTPLVLSGGLFSNVKLNLSIKRLGFKNIFICPPMGDEGLAIGSAILLNQCKYSLPLHSNQLSAPSFTSVFLGLNTNNDDLEKFSSLINAKAPENLSQQIAKILAKNCSVAIVRGQMEFGPRSLGHRSIFHSASNSSINDSLNKKLNRTEFMPFAPIMRIESAKDYLNLADVSGAYETSKFMTICVEATPKFQSLCPAVVHVDGTCRPQLVERSSSPFIYDILACYEDLTGLPALINTSFNMHEEPIVCSAIDALKAFIYSGLDFLAFEDYLISQQDIKPLKEILLSINNNLTVNAKNDFQKLETEFWRNKFYEIDELLVTHNKHITNLESTIKQLNQ